MTNKKNRVEITFSDAEQDLWEYLESSNLKKATFIKQILRDHMIGNSDILQEKIKAALAEVVSNNTQDVVSSKPSTEIDVFGGKEF